MFSTEVTTTATTDLLLAGSVSGPTGYRVVYRQEPTDPDRLSTYTVALHPPTPRDQASR